MNKKPAKPEELPIPQAAIRDDKAREMIRGWIAEGDLWCSINVGSWAGVEDINEANAWGILLSDVAHHVADALHQQHGTDREQTLSRIQAAWNYEFEKPTSGYRGNFVTEDE